MSESPKVVVIGGGYAGVMAANRLRQRNDVTVTLINPRPTFVERLRRDVGIAPFSAIGYDERSTLEPGTMSSRPSAQRTQALWPPS